VAELGRFVDERGVIQDLLLGPIDSVTQIYTKAGHVRGNHVHKETIQWVYVIYGALRVAQEENGELKVRTHGPNSLITEAAGVPHAWKAMSDCVVLVITRGPRSGNDYETDTTRLTTPLLS